MKNSSDRILSTHVGSLARPDDLLALLFSKERSEDYDPDLFEKSVGHAVSEIVRKQVEAGIDVIGDGEQGKASFLTYAADRLTGFSPREEEGEDLWKESRETIAFPEYYEANRRLREGLVAKPVKLVCTSPIQYEGHTVLQRDIANLKAAIAEYQPEETFMTAISPSDIEGQQANEFYATEEDYLYAIADAMHQEYQAIVDAGFILQVDDPRLLTYYISRPDLSVDDCRKWAEVRVEVLNHALQGIPEERIRFHSCYGINIGPRVHEMDLGDIVDIMLRVNAGAYSFEAGNPRHEHEWKVWEEVKLPEGKLILPGVISHSTPLVEHPELVAQRLVRFANAVGRENVIASSDCGFASFASSEQEIHPRIVWAKFANLAEGARIASQSLW
ncbi:MAG: cobalamin-independent methionine synthase II family protein [Verrucomicrobia bacterium]|nr:cobalamin-independent methionine synthase II family protein [Verrucomicrobiota bacterium]